MSSDYAYNTYYRGVQLGDECYGFKPRPDFARTNITRLYQSPLAALNRNTSGRLMRWSILVHLVKSDILAVADQIEQFNSLIDTEVGIVEIYQGVNSPTLVKTIEDAWLDAVIPSTDDSPARGRITPVTLDFLTTKTSR